MDKTLKENSINKDIEFVKISFLNKSIEKTGFPKSNMGNFLY